MMLSENDRIQLFLHRFCKLCRITVLADNGCGIKAYNKKQPVFSIEDAEEIEMDAAELLLGFDGLRDGVTLTGTPIPLSPHYELIRLISEGKDISGCDYINRERTGRLDGRFAIRVDPKEHKRATEKTIAAVTDGSCKPPLLYRIDDRYYILDGKHRAAAASLTGSRIVCKVLSVGDIKNCDYHKRLYRKMQKAPEKYSANLKLMDPMYK